MCIQGLVRKPEGKTPLGRLKGRWKDTTKIDLQVVGYGGMERIELAQDRDRGAGMCECGNESSGSIKCREFLD